MLKLPFRKIIGVCAAVLMVFSMISLEILDVYAISPTYTVSSDYKSSKYYKNLNALILTGNQRSDVVRVALSQIGYHEGNSDKDFAGGNTKGSRNFVEYNRYHGKLDNNEGNGYSFGYYWCAAFSTWCAVQAGIPEEIVPTANFVGVSTQRLRLWFINNAHYYSRGKYTPITGDYIFFKDANAAVPTTHVGLVLYVKGNTVYTIEGNAGGNDAVALKEYSLTDSYIAGYGVPNYTTGTEVTIDLTNRQNPGEYITTPSSLSLRAGPGTSYTPLSALPQATVTDVTEIDGNWGKVTYNGISGWISLSYAMPLSMPSIVIRYDANGGTGAPASQGKMPGKPILLSTKFPSRAGYQFLGWSTSPTATKALYASGGSYTRDQSVTFYAVWEKETYIVQFVDHDGKTLQSRTYGYGETVTPPTVSDREADLTYRYTFSGWDKTVTKAVASATYTAQYKKQYIDYTVTFRDEDGTVLSMGTYHYQDTVATPPVPSKASDKTYFYTFVGWGEPISRVTGDKSYTAVYEKTYLEYPITFSDENGIIISQQLYHYGDSVKQPDPPVKKSDAYYDYVFVGWDKEVSAVHGVAFYTATYAKEPRKYSVTFQNGDGTLLTSGEYAYAETVTVPDDPAMATDERYEYAFLGWSADGEAVTTVLPVTSDATYTAVYQKTPIEYTVVFRDEGGNVYSSETYHYGDAVKIPSDPVKAATAMFEYQFAGWDSEVSETVVGDAVYVAQFTQTPIESKKPSIGHILSPIGGDESSISVIGIMIIVSVILLTAWAMIRIARKKR